MRTFLALTLLIVADVAAAQVPRIAAIPPECLEPEGNGVVGLAGSTDAGELRVYFRRDGYGDFYWVPADDVDTDAPWAVLPVPEPDNHMAELYAAVVDETGRIVAQSVPVRVPVDDDCDEDDKTDEQRSRSHDLTIGETSRAQRLRKVAWWRCEGVDERIDVDGEERRDETCFLAWWERPGAVVPLAVLGGGGILDVVDDGGDEAPELSPSRP